MVSSVTLRHNRTSCRPGFVSASSEVLAVPGVGGLVGSSEGLRAHPHPPFVSELVMGAQHGSGSVPVSGDGTYFDTELAENLAKEREKTSTLSWQLRRTLRFLTTLETASDKGVGVCLDGQDREDLIELIDEIDGAD